MLEQSAAYFSQAARTIVLCNLASFMLLDNNNLLNCHFLCSGAYLVKVYSTSSRVPSAKGSEEAKKTSQPTTNIAA